MNQKPYKPLFKEAKEADEKYMLDFILKNREHADKYRIHDLYVAVVTSKFRKETESYVSDKFENDLIKFKAPSNWITYEELMKLWNDHTASTGLTPLEQKEKERFDYVFNSEAYGWNGKDTFDNVKGISVDSIIELLLYVTTGKLEGNRNYIDIWKDIVDEYDIDTWRPIFKNVVHKDLKGLTLSKLKNGKMIIKGLTSKQAETISRLEELCFTNRFTRKFYPKDKYPVL